MRRGYRRKRLRRLMTQLADICRTFSVAHRKTRWASMSDTGSFNWSHYAAAR
jgi:hypothetical protein